MEAVRGFYFLPSSLAQLLGGDIEPENRVRDPARSNNANRACENQSQDAHEERGAGIGIQVCHEIRLGDDNCDEPFQTTPVGEWGYVEKIIPIRKCDPHPFIASNPVEISIPFDQVFGGRTNQRRGTFDGLKSLCRGLWTLRSKTCRGFEG